MSTTIVTNARLLDADGPREGWLILHGDRIAATGLTGRDAQPATTIVLDLHGRTVTPGFIDLHGHGGGGASYDNGADEIATALAVHRAHGRTRSVISLVANPLVDVRELLSLHRRIQLRSFQQRLLLRLCQ